MKLAIVGSRSLYDFDISPFVPLNISRIITGGADGVDNIAECYANDFAIECLIIFPQYRRYGKAAPLRRNDEIVKACDEMLAFFNDEVITPGTRYSINQMKKAGKPCTVVFYRPKGESVVCSAYDREF